MTKIDSVIITCIYPMPMMLDLEIILHNVKERINLQELYVNVQCVSQK